MIKKYSIYSENLKREVTYNFIKNDNSDLYIYFFDGQNLYDPEESYMGEVWAVDKAIEKLGIEANVIGIYSPSDYNRFNEYTFYEKSDDIEESLDFEYEAKGIETGKFIVDELIPYIEADNPADTRIIAGSSLGGLMSLYMGMTYPDKFNKVLAMSSYFRADLVQSAQMLAGYKAENQQKIYMDVGSSESENADIRQAYIESNKMAYGFLKDKVLIKFVIDEGAIHNEKEWRRRLPEALEYLLDN